MARPLLIPIAFATVLSTAAVASASPWEARDNASGSDAALDATSATTPNPPSSSAPAPGTPATDPCRPAAPLTGAAPQRAGMPLTGPATVAVVAAGRSGNARSPSYDEGAFGGKGRVRVAMPVADGVVEAQALLPRGRSGNTRGPAYDGGNYPSSAATDSAALAPASSSAAALSPTTAPCPAVHPQGTP